MYCTGAFSTKERREGEVRSWPQLQVRPLGTGPVKGRKEQKHKTGNNRLANKLTNQEKAGRDHRASMRQKQKKNNPPGWPLAVGGRRISSQAPYRLRPQITLEGHVRLAKANGSSRYHVPLAGPRMESKSVILSELCTWSVVDRTLRYSHCA